MSSLARGLRRRTQALVDRAPVPYTSSRAGSGSSMSGLERGSPTPGGQRDQLESMGVVSTLFAIVDINANTVARVEWKLYLRAPSGLKEDRTEVRPGATPMQVVLDRPNGFMGRQELVETVQQHYELTGEGWLVAARSGGLPIELWPVRPDRIRPVRSPSEFIVGYMYTDPDGNEVPLPVEDVAMMRGPNPLDVYRGMGRVQTLSADLEATDAAAQWNRMFFRNSAEPGGVVEYAERMTDGEFEETVKRWREQHQGVNNAHRVAFIEGGKWVPRTYTRRDMEFTELRGDMRDVIREAFAFPRLMLGSGEDSNRATAEGMIYIHAVQHLVPRLERWKQTLNGDLMRMFGMDPRRYEWDYPEEVVPANREADVAEITAKSTAAVALLGAGADPTEVFEYLQLPLTKVEKPEPPAPPAIPGRPPGGNIPENLILDASGFSVAGVRAALAATSRPYALPAGVRAAAEEVDAIDLSEVEDDYQAVLSQLLADWGGVEAEQRDQLVKQVREAVEDGDVTGLAGLECEWNEGAAILLAAMLALASLAAQQVVREAGRQGVDPADITPTVPARSVVKKAADATAELLARGMALSAGQEALRVRGTTSTGAEVADRVRMHLSELTDARPRQVLGGALTGVQNQARVATLRAGPTGAIYASEQLDQNTCKPCRAVHGRWLGNIDAPDMLAQIDAVYPQGAYGGYKDCLGGSRCRGTVVGVWRPRTVGGS